MIYRKGTYIAFHARGTKIPTESDIKYYNLMMAWTANRKDEFYMVNSHEKTAAVRDGCLRETLRRRLKERLNISKNMVLIVGETTRFDTDWVPFEISYAIDYCGIPLIVAYTDYEYILEPEKLTGLLPDVLIERINNGTASAIHIPFKKEPIKDAISQFNHNKKPLGGGFGVYSKEAYRSFGISIS